MLADVVEPVKGYQRGGQQPGMTTLGPLTHLVDAVSTDSMSAREVTPSWSICSRMRRILLRAGAAASVFRRWRDGQPRSSRLPHGAGLAEVTPLADDLARCGAVGLDAFAVSVANASPLDAWRDARIATWTRSAAEGRAGVPVRAAMRELVVGAMAQAEMKTMSAAEWRARVRALARPAGRAGVVRRTPGVGLNRPVPLSA